MGPGEPSKPPRRGVGTMVGALPWLLIAAVMFFSLRAGPIEEESIDDRYSYTAFLAAVDEGAIESIELAPDGTATGQRSDGTEYGTQIPVDLAGEDFLQRLEAAAVQVEAVGETTSWGQVVAGWMIALLPIALLIGFWVYLGRRATGALGGSMSMGRSKAKVFDTERPTTTFGDVAGYQEVKREIMEIADFVRAPERYRRAGASAPRGVLMTGPPGTGKTLFARALAGEVGVPFLTVTGSSFVEMFVGVGAARVRDLFEEARKVAPAIIFVDEIDAIGQRRQGGSLYSNDEREQTLNQLLAEMDGFDPSVGIIVLAATNRPEVLDAALLRPGRFDRQVMIPLPNQEERRAILVVHCRHKHLVDQVDLGEVARGTPGFSGADLANLVNEAAIRAARDDREAITAADIDEARDRILLGLRGGPNVLLPEERLAVAAHEAGHALVAAHCSNADPVHRVTILPSGHALGVTQQLPEHERHLYSERYLYDTLSVQLGGRSAELEVFGQGSTGAANDLATATAIATKMVKEYGLSPELGPVAYPGGGPMFLDSEATVGTRPYADATQRLVDSAVARIVNEAQERAQRIVALHRNELDLIIERLLAEETIDGREVYGITGRPTPEPRPQVLKPPTPEPSYSTPADGD
jgi:cell division protease FtsH